MGVSNRQFGDGNMLLVPGQMSAGFGAPRDDGSPMNSRPLSNIARLLKTPEFRNATRSVTPKVLSRSQSRTLVTPRAFGTSVATQRTRQKRIEEENLRTKIFWEQYAKEVKCDILKDNDEETPKTQLIYSGHCGPELKFKRSDSCESLETNLSLLSTSSLGNKSTKEVKRKKKKKEAIPEVKPDWVRLAKERKGALDRLIAKDASNMQGIAQVSGSNIIMQRAKVSELMSEEEKTLLHDCGYRQGLAGREKSGSTANILSVVMKKDATKLKKHRLNHIRFRGTSETPSECSSRAPSPGVIAKEVREQKRSESSMAAFADPAQITHHRMSIGRGQKPDLKRRDTIATLSSIHGLRNYQESNILTGQVKKRIGKTLGNLEDMTGYGDPTDAQTVMSDDRKYTRADYAVIPRYPQHIRIAPQLSKVIIQDIRKRMGRPRYHELRTSDIERLNLSLPELGRTTRNLMIFNWLISLDDDYDDMSVPGVYDLEGQPPNDRYPVIYDEIIGLYEGSEAAETEYETETNGASSIVASCM